MDIQLEHVWVNPRTPEEMAKKFTDEISLHLPFEQLTPQKKHHLWFQFKEMIGNRDKEIMQKMRSAVK